MSVRSTSVDKYDTLAGSGVSLTFALPQLVKFVLLGKSSELIHEPFLVGLDTLAASKNLTTFKLYVETWGGMGEGASSLRSINDFG